jgi:hypothetical protein
LSGVLGRVIEGSSRACGEEQSNTGLQSNRGDSLKTRSSEILSASDSPNLRKGRLDLGYEI